MSTPVLNNGIFLQDTEMQISSHLDSYHLRNQLGNAKPTDFGVIDLWAMTQKAEMPLYQLSKFGGKNIVTVDDPKGEWTWQNPITNDLPYVVEDVEDESNTALGIEGTTFKIKLNERAFGHGDIITYDKMNGAELFITAEDILPQGDGYVYTVQMPNNNSTRTFNRAFLKPGTQYFRVGSAKGEYGEKYSDINLKVGYRQYYNFVGNAKAHVHFSVTDEADTMIRGGMRAEGATPVTEIWRCYDKNILDPSIKNFQDLKAKLGDSGIKDALKEGKLSASFLTQMEAAHMTKIAQDIERYLMWGKGGLIKQDGPDDVRLSVGLWKQLDDGNVHAYAKKSFSLDMFRSEIYNFYAGKVDFNGPDPKRQIIVQTGLAGMEMVNKAIEEKALGNLRLNFNGDKSGLNVINGAPMDLGFQMYFTNYTIPFLANVRFVLNPALDNVSTNDIENPKIDGYPLSSYSFIIFDITDNTQDNIYLLKRAKGNEFRWRYVTGTMDHNGRTAGIESVGNFPGYRVYMEQAYPSIWVKDPSKVLKLVMKNPITGGHL